MHCDRKMTYLGLTGSAVGHGTQLHIKQSSPGLSPSQQHCVELLHGQDTFITTYSASLTT